MEYIHKKKSLDVVHDDIIYYSANAEDGNAFVEIAMKYNESYNEWILSFANDIRTSDG